jgi:drug/metabolite transporter (DMT)-like permease
MLAIAAFGISGLAFAINAQYGASIGETTLTSWTFMGLAIAVDLLALTLAPAAVGLWRSKQRGFSIATWATWGMAVFLATLATLGFFQKNLAETAATRAASVTMTAATQDQRVELIAAAKLAVSVAKASRESECASRGRVASKGRRTKEPP